MALIYVSTIPLWTVGAFSLFVNICELFFHVLRIYFLFSINDVNRGPLNSPGELSSQFLLIAFYFIHSQRTPCVKRLPFTV